MLAPRTAKQARLLRLISKSAHAPADDHKKMVWVNSQIRKERDVQLSIEEEQLREKLMPVAGGSADSPMLEGSDGAANIFHFREFPLYPGEYIPPEHNTLASLRDELAHDLRAQSLKDAWIRVSGGKVFRSVSDYYAGSEGIDEHQLGEIVAALFPGIGIHESRALIQKVLESLSKPSNTTSRQLSRTITAEAVGLDNAPQHYSNFLEWMGRITDTKAFKTEHALFQFCRRKFNRSDVQVMFENYSLMSRGTLQQESADGYSHFGAVLKDYSVKIAGEDTRHQLGTRIDEAEIDQETGIAVGFGKKDQHEFTALIRENKHSRGAVRVMGKSLADAMDNKSWFMEMVMMPFDEAGLNFKDFDVYFVNEGMPTMHYGDENIAIAMRMALAVAITKLLPLTRIPLKKAGLLSFDRRRKMGQFPGFRDGERVGGSFRKR